MLNFSHSYYFLQQATHSLRLLKFFVNLKVGETIEQTELNTFFKTSVVTIDGIWQYRE